MQNTVTQEVNCALLKEPTVRAQGWEKTKTTSENRKEVNMNSNRLLVALTALVLVGVSMPHHASGCEIDIDVIKGEKQAYAVGDQFMVLVKVVLTHRVCPEAINKTKFKLKGLKVLKATGWKQVTTTEYHRKLIVEVIDDTDDTLILSAIRKCDKDGGFGSLALEVVPRQ